MFPDKLLQFVEGVPPPAAPPRGVETAEAFATLRWLSVPGLDGYRVLDCRSLALSMTTATRSAEIAARFASLRDDDGARLDSATIAEPLKATCVLPLPGFDRADGPVFRAPEMEWKWDATQRGGRLLFSRSWTGDLVAAATLAGAGDARRVVEVEVSAPLCDGDARTAVCLVQALARVYALAKIAPHPLPTGAPVTTVQDAFMYSWSLHGRAAFFAAPMQGLP